MAIQYNSALLVYNSVSSSYNGEDLRNMLAYDWGSPYNDAAIGYEMLRVDYDAALAYDGPFPYGGSVVISGVSVGGLIQNTSFVAELNRLANDGYYPTPPNYLTATRAANVWAGTNGLTLIAALNYINNRRLSQPTLLAYQHDYAYNASYIYGGQAATDMLALLGVCNAIAGTTNKSSADALGSIE